MNDNTTYIPHAIPLTELAKVIGHKVAEVETEAVELGMFVGRDWAGRVAIADADAHGLVSGQVRRTRESEAEWTRHLAACEAWTHTRDELVRSSQAAAELAAQRAGRGGGDAAQAGVEAGRSVGVRYETTTPPPMIGGETTAVMLYAAEDRRGLLARARTLLAGAPR